MITSENVVSQAQFKNDCMFLSYHVRVSKWIHTLDLPECQTTPCSK